MSTASPVRPAPAARSEALVAGQLQQVRQRIRLLDATASLLGFAILTLLYALGMILLDRAFEMTAGTRQTAFGVYVFFSAVYLGYTLLWPLCRRLNPYYAALQVEQTLPEAKNSVISWLDLHEKPLPGSIRAAVANKAARDISGADLETAISARRSLWLTAVVFILGLAMFAQLVIGGPQFFSLLRRAFAPFSEARIATRTHLTLLKPERGDVTVPVGRAVTFAVEVRGKVPSSSRPDAVRLLYRYHPEDPHEEQRLEPGNSPGEWTTILPAYLVHNGFWYKIAGGDTETPEYRVSVRSTPLLTDFEATYRFRPYLGWKEQTTREPNLQALRGTEVTLIARANRTVRDAKLELVEQKQFIAAERLANEPQAMRFRWVLDRDGTYRISFVSEDDERNSDPMPYEIKVLPDLAPRVVWSQPGKDVTVPINQKLDLRGAVNDDFGLAGITLRLQTDQGTLKPIAYPQEGLQRRADGSQPRNIDYRESIALDQLALDGKKLAPGATIEYWLEATDQCDYPPPGPNLGQSERFKVTLAPPAPEQKDDPPQEQQPKDDANKGEKGQPPPKNDSGKSDKPQEQPPKDGKQDGQGKEGNQPNGQPKGDPDKKDAQRDKRQKPEAQKDGPPGAPGQQNSQQQSPEDKRLQEQKERLEQALKDKEKEQQDKGDNTGQAKSNNDNQGQAKDGQPDNRQQTGQTDKNKPQDKGDQPKSDRQQTDQTDKNKGDQPKSDRQQTDQTDKNKGDQSKSDRQQTDQTDKNKGDQSKSDRQQTDQTDRNKGDQSKSDRQQTDQTDRNKGDQPKSDRQQTDQRDKNQTNQPQDKGDRKPDDKQPGEKDKKPGQDSGHGEPGQQAPPQPTGPSGDKKPAPKPQENGQDQPPKQATGRKEIKDTGKEAEERVGTNDKPNAGNAKLEKLTEAMKKVADQLKNADPKTRQQLLDKAKELAKDPQAREALEKALKEAAKDPQKKQTLEKMLKEAAQRGDKEPTSKDDPKDNTSPKTDRTNSGKPTDPGPNSGTTQGNADKPPTQPGQDTKSDANSQPGKGEPAKADSAKGEPSKGPPAKPQGDGAAPPKDGPPKPGKPGENPGLAGDGTREGGNPTGPSEAPEGDPADPRFQKKAGELQLEDFWKRVTKDVLQKANMTEAEYQQFRKAYAEMLKRRPPEAAQKAEQLADPKRAGGVLKNQGPSRVQGGPKQDALQGGVPRHAPPEYLEKYNEFTQKLSDLNRPKDR